MGRRLLAVEVPVGSESYHRFESAFFVAGRKAASFVEFSVKISRLVVSRGKRLNIPLVNIPLG